MPYDGHAPARFASTMLSRLDLSDGEVLKDAEHQFQRCTTDADFASWARTWGAPVITHLRDAAPTDWVDPEDVREIEGERDRTKEELGELQSAVKLAINDLDGVMDGVADELANMVGAITSKLEESL